MKKGFLLILLCIVTLITSAQEHFTFRGVPIDGPVNDFVAAMQEKGYSYDHKTDAGVVVLKGSFVGYSGCEIWVVSTPSTQSVCKVLVWLPEEKDSWYTLKNMYTKCVDSYTTKYGVPSKDYHMFLKPYYEGDGYELQAVRKDKTGFMCFWNNLDNVGSISVEITKWCQVKITYEDSSNMSLMKAEKNTAIQDEI